GICLALPNAQAYAQSGYKHMDKVFEQASETSGLVVQYARDIQAVNHFYGAMAQAGRNQQLVYAPDQLQRLIALDEQYLRTLKAQPFDEFSIHGQTDYILL